jgi:hypothetical protein
MNRRSAVIVGGVTLAVLMGAGVLVSLSVVQTWAARKLVAANVPQTVTFDRLSVSFNRIHVDGLRISDGPFSIEIPRLTAAAPGWAWARGAFHLKYLEAKGWTAKWDPASAPLQISQTVAPAEVRETSAGWGATLGVWGGAEGESAAAGQDLASWLQLPFELEIAQLDLEGNLEWRDAGPGEDGHAKVMVAGGGLGVGQKSSILVTVAAKSEAGVDAGIQTLNIEAEVEVQLAAPDRIGGIWISATLRGKGASNVQWDGYKFDLGFDALGETPRLQFSFADEKQPLFTSDILAKPGELGLAGVWSISLSDETVSNLMLGTVLPRFTMEGAGEIRSSYHFQDLELGASVAFEADRLEVLEPKAGAIGELTGQLEFSGKRLGQDLRVTRMDLNLEGAEPVLRARLLQGVEYSFAGLEVRVEQPSDPVVVVDLMGLPLSWLQPWLSPWVIDGRPITGKMVALATDRGLRLGSTEPFKGNGIVAAMDGKSIVEGLDFALNFGTEITPEGWQVEIDHLVVGDSAGIWAEVSARGGKLVAENEVLKVAGRIQADLSSPSRLPILEGRWGLSGGRIDGEFGVGVSERFSLALALELKDLVAVDATRLPDLQLDGRLDRLADGVIEAHLPMQLTRGSRVSDLTLNSRMTPSATGWHLEGSLSGPRVYLGDTQLLAMGLALNLDPITEGAAVAGAAARKTFPVWHGVKGKIETAIGFLELPNGLAVSNLRGEIAITDDGLVLPDLKAGVAAGGTIRLNGTVAFDPTKAQPYTAKAHLNAEAIEAGPMLKTLQVPLPLPFEGGINLTADWLAEAESWDAMLEKSSLDATLTSTGGVLRVLGVDVDQYVNIGKTATALGGLLAKVTGDTRTQSYVSRLESLTAVAEQLSAVSFDQLNLVVKRAATGSIEISELSLISPSVRLWGHGGINYRPEIPFWSQPLHLQMRLSARDQLAANLQDLKLLQAEADPLGYLPLREDVILDGSLANVGTSELGKLLSQALAAP